MFSSGIKTLALLIALSSTILATQCGKDGSAAEEEIVLATPPDPSTIEYHATVEATNLYGRRLTKHFLDLKLSPGAMSTEAKAEPYFGTDGMNGVRIPIYGNDANPAHPSKGVVEGSYYTNVITSVKNARSARGGEEFTVFASKKLSGTTTFPEWVRKTDSYEVDPTNYVEMLVDFVTYFNSMGIEIDVLGVDNEIEWSKSGIDAATYKEIVDLAKVRFAQEGLNIPQFIAHERYLVEGDTAGGWLNTLYSLSYEDRMDIYGVHFYPEDLYKSGRPANFEYELTKKGDKPFWASEPHWGSSTAYPDVLYHAEQAIATLWLHTDLGVDNIIWWDYGKGDNLRHYLMNEITVPLLNSQPVVMSDHDGDDLTSRGVVHTRAFLNSDEKLLHIYAINSFSEEVSQSTFKSYSDYEFTLSGVEVAAATAQCTQYSDTTAISGSDKTLDICVGNKIYVDIPARSVTHITVTIK